MAWYGTATGLVTRSVRSKAVGAEGAAEEA